MLTCGLSANVDGSKYATEEFVKGQWATTMTALDDNVFAWTTWLVHPAFYAGFFVFPFLWLFYIIPFVNFVFLFIFWVHWLCQLGLWVFAIIQMLSIGPLVGDTFRALAGGDAGEGEEEE